MCELCFCLSSLAIGHYQLRLDARGLQSLTVITLVYSGQAILYVSRERRHFWSSRPGYWLICLSCVDIIMFSILATRGIMMAPLALPIVASVLLGAMGFAVVLDTAKLALTRYLPIG